MDNSTLLKIKNELDIVDIVSETVDLSKKGRNYWGICPFHEDSNPSMSVSPDKQLFKCFVCGTGGDLIKYNSLINKISFRESLTGLAKKIGIEVKSFARKEVTYSESDSKLIKVTEDAMLFFQYSLSTEEGQKALTYANKRHLNSSTREDFLIGYAPASGLANFLRKKGHDEATIINSSLLNQSGGDFFRDRLIFGIRNNDGKIVAFSARDLTGNAQAKYINSAETKIFSKSSVLYNFSSSKEQIRQSKEVYINEGFMDVIAMSRAGIKNSVAIMGTALTKPHLSSLRGNKVILMLDGDKAGIAATFKSIKLLLENNIDSYVVVNEEGLDPDEILEKHGVETLLEITKNRITALEFIYNLHKDKYKDITPETINDFLVSFSKYLKGQSQIVIDFYKNKLMKDLEVSNSVVDSAIVVEKQNIKSTPIVKKKEVVHQKVARNYSYTLILSILKNAEFLDLSKKTPIHFAEQILPSIVRYIDKFNHGNIEKPNMELKMKVQEIQEYDNFVNTSDEFLDLIKRVNKESIEWKIEACSVKLSNTPIESEKIKYAEQIAVLKKELLKD